jgi:hypothetical protein
MVIRNKTYSNSSKGKKTIEFTKVVHLYKTSGYGLQGIKNKAPERGEIREDLRIDKLLERGGFN